MIVFEPSEAQLVAACEGRIGLDLSPRLAHRAGEIKQLELIMAVAFTFPGQGSQSVGMGKDLADAFPEARRVFEEVDEALGEKLSALIWDGP